MESSHNSIVKDPSGSSQNSLYQTDNYDWLVGHWKRINEGSLKSTYEHWTKKDASHYQGHGYTMKEQDTLWQEQMEFKKIENVWHMEISTPGNNTNVVFKQSSASDTSFIVQNRLHDFPTSIHYYHADDRLEAVVSNSAKQILFSFKKIESKKDEISTSY